MRDVVSQIFGVQGSQIVQMIGALLVVVVLIVLFAWAMRRFGGGGRQPAARRGERPTQRLAVVDAAHVDGQRRLVLVRRDDVEHLVMIGGPNDVLIEPRIVRGQPMGGQRMAPAVPYPVAAPVAQQPAPYPQQQQQPQPQPVRATGAPQQPTTAQQAPAVPMPPPFVEPVTSPAASARANPIAADLRAAMGDNRRPDDLVDTQRDPHATRQHTAPQPAPMPQPAPRQAPPPMYDEPTVAAPRQSYAPEPAPYAPPVRTAATRQPSPSAAPSLEDMVAAGLEQAISRPDPAPTRPVTRSGAAFGQRVDPTGFDGRTPAKDAVAAEIEKAIYGLTAPGGPAPGRGPLRQDIARPAPYGAQRDAEPAPRPVGRYDAQRGAPQEPTVAISRLPQATPPAFPRAPMPARPTLVSQPEPPVPEPVVAVMPPPDAVRNEARADNGRRSSSDIEDEMARLLSELTGTAGR